MITIRNRKVREGGRNEVISVSREVEDDFITLAEVKTHLRIDFSDEDTYIGSLIPVGREMIENYTGRALVPSEVTVILRNEISGMMLPWQPYVDSLVLKDTDGNTISADDYEIKGSELFQYSYGEIRATYNSGYDEDTLPPSLKMAVLHQIAFLYEKRGDSGMSPVARTLAAPFVTKSWIV